MATMIALGVLAGGWLIAGDQALDQAVLARDYRSMHMARRAFFPTDPVVADGEASLVLVGASSVVEASGPLVAAAERATELEPDYPFWWARLAQANHVVGDADAMKLALDRAIALQSSNRYAWELMYTYGRRVEDENLQRTAVDRVCALGGARCERLRDELGGK